MKPFLLLVVSSFVLLDAAHSQTLYGTTASGGSHNSGTINKFTVSSNTLAIPESMQSIASLPVNGKFLQASDGKLYAMTMAGGGSDLGTLFSFDPATSSSTILIEFDATTGSSPFGSLIQAADGKLYGMTQNGGKKNLGVIFSFDPVTSVYSKIFDFENTHGANPLGSLLEASDGKLYGMASLGGANNYGVLFSFNIATSSVTTLFDFDNTNGANPPGSLMQANDGKLYGMVQRGGSSNHGIIFSFDITSASFLKVKDFDNTNGAFPAGDLIQASDGILYGVTDFGGMNDLGVIFSFLPSTSTYNKLVDFNNATGGNPTGSLLQANDGNFYGLASNGGANGAGAIFSYDLTNYSDIKDFDNPIGRSPKGSLIQANDGKVYGMTFTGGASNNGVVFSLDLSSAPGNFTKLNDFGTNATGLAPAGSLLVAKDKKLYGLTTFGGSSDGGVIYSFDPATSNYAKLADFHDTIGINPHSNLIQATDGRLYGMTTAGGANSHGVIFAYDPTTANYKKLLDFHDVDGTDPGGSLVQATDGKLYGMTHAGGSSGHGVIFSFDPVNAAFTKVIDFNGSNGGGPSGTLMQANDGKLYGTASGGVNGYGVLFSFDISTATFTKLLDFDLLSGKGAVPIGSLIQLSNGKLYGLTSDGGAAELGVIYSYDPATLVYTKLLTFDGLNGSRPLGGSLMQASDGKLYGMTHNGGIDFSPTNLGNGVIFSFDPSGSTYTKLVDFNGTNGANPFGGFIEVPDAGPLPVTWISFTGKNIGRSNELSWKVGTELNLNYYELQRSVDGQNFKEVAQIKATGNNAYSFIDPISSSSSSLFYYRLKSVDKDGHFKFSDVIKIKISQKGFIVVNPNPFKNKLVVQVESPIRDRTSFILTDMSGRRLFKETKMLSNGTNTIEINETERLSKGTYLLTIIESDQTQSIKVVKGN
jgi:uncharacterized repeat protein (TIGR03803 family)